MAFYSSELAAADKALTRAADDITPDEAVVRVGGKWSAAEICEHLTLAFAINTKAVEKSVAERQVRLRPSSLRQRLAKWLVLGLGHFPRSQSPEMVRPRGDRGVITVEEVRRRLLALDAALAEATHVFGERTPFLNHPILGPFSVRDWRRFHLAHVRHHMKQVEERLARLRRGGASAVAK